jgi:ABC-type dipeptide/oligopeptide/nickel transport system permease component
MTRFLKFAGKRLLFTIPQLFAVSVIVFFLIRLLPGDPSYMLAGPYASPGRIDEVREAMTTTTSRSTVPSMTALPDTTTTSLTDSPAGKR